MTQQWKKQRIKTLYFKKAEKENPDNDIDDLF